MENIKTSALAIIGVIGAFIANLLGGWDTALQTLLLFMAIDYGMGLIIAGVFHKSGKTETGRLNSHAGWKGLCKKGVTLLIILVATQLDLLMGLDYIRYGAIIAYITIEVISIVENSGIMGVPIPTIIKNAIDLLKKKEDEEFKDVRE